MAFHQIKSVEFGIEARQRFIDDLSYPAQRVHGGDTLLKINTTEQQSARLVRPAHLHPRFSCAEDESCSLDAAGTWVFQHPARGFYCNCLKNCKHAD